MERAKINWFAREVRGIVASQAGFEPATRCLEGSRSVHLSYWDSETHLHPDLNRYFLILQERYETLSRKCQDLPVRI